MVSTTINSISNLNKELKARAYYCKILQQNELQKDLHRTKLHLLYYFLVHPCIFLCSMAIGPCNHASV